MERKDFLKKIAFAGFAVSVLPVTQSCIKDNTTTPTNTSGACTESPTEVEGPYPYTADGTTRNELSNPLNRSDIRSNSSDGAIQTGIPLSLQLTVVNVNNSCALVSDARVDIWCCNKDGYYSGYAGQPGILGTQSYVGKDWMRGYQVTGSAGLVTFNMIYPGWYSGRATHIHFEVFISGVLKKVGQMAFPESISDVVHVSSLYAAHGINTTRNASDSIFGNSSTDLANETIALTGNTTDGYTGTHTIGLAL